MKLIDIDKVIAEIKKLKGKVYDGSSYCNGWQHALRMLEIELATLETKEVDLEKDKPVTNDLERAALLHYPKMSRISEPHGIIPADNKSHYLGDANEDNRKAFIVGAQWQKQQNTLEAKELDLEKELERLDSLLYDLDGIAITGTTSYLTVEDVKDIAKRFFEMGLKAQEITKKKEQNMITIKSYTSLEQSKKLTEILPIKSADMFYRNNGIDVKLMWEHTAQKVESPCWSLAALMDVLDRGALFKTPKGWVCQTYVEYEAIIGNFHSNPVDACVEMILELHKQKDK